MQQTFDLFSWLLGTSLHDSIQTDKCTGTHMHTPTQRWPVHTDAAEVVSYRVEAKTFLLSYLAPCETSQSATPVLMLNAPR